MFFSRWTFFQGLIVILLVVLALIADLFKQDIAVPFSAGMEVNKSMFMTLLFIAVIVGLQSSILYMQTKKSDTFLKHPVWYKMHVIISGLFVISLIGIFIIFLTDPLNTIVQNNRWLLYVLMYYVLFLINLLVLAIIHKAKKKSISSGNKVFLSFVWTTLSLFVIIMIL